MDTTKTGIGGSLAKLGVIAWSVWIVLDYVVHHPYLTKSLTTLPYAELLVPGLLLGAFAGYLVNKKIGASSAKSYAISYRGIWVYLLVQLVALVLVGAFVANALMPKLATSTRLGYFFGFSSLYFLGLLLMVIVGFALGNAVWDLLFRKSTPTALLVKNQLLKIALGFSLLGTLLVVIGQLGLFKVYVLWVIVVAILGWQWKASWQFFKDLVWTQKQLELRNWWMPPLLLLVLTVTAFNWVAAFKVFPIGFDGSSLYVNTARLIAGNGYLPAGGQAYNWSVMMAFGQTLFADGVFAILLSHLMNVMCLFIVYRLARLWLSADVALLASAVFLLSPYVAFHGIVDEKIDLALAFFVLAGFYPLAALSRAADDEEKAVAFRLPLGVVVLVGWLTGYAFGIKYTAVMYLLAIITWYFYLRGGKFPFFAAFFGVLAVVFLGGIYRFGYLDISTNESLVLGGIFALLAVVITAYAYRENPKKLLVPIRQLAILGGVFFLAFTPWAIKNLSENQVFSVSSMIEGKAASPEITIVSLSSLYHPNMNSGNFLSQRNTWSDLPDSAGELQFIKPPFAHLTNNLDQVDGRNATGTAAKEEIQRYLGYEDELWRYTSLPYDLTMNTNIPNNRYLDIGYLYLLLLPLLLLVSRRGNRPWWLSMVLVIALVCFIALVYASVFAQGGQVFDPVVAKERSLAIFQQHPGGANSWLALLYAAVLAPVLWLAAALGPLYAIGTQLTTTGAMLVLVASYLGFYALFRNRLLGLPKSFVGFGVFLSVYAFIWWIMGNGIIWYAMPLFIVFPIFLLYWFEHPAQFMPSDAAFSRWFLGAVIGLGLLFNTALYFTSAYETDEGSSALFRWPFVDYMSNPTAKKAKVINYFNPIMSEATRIMNADKKAKIYRVNTHFGYVIDQNDTRVFSDPTLEKFDEIASRYNDESQFLDQLKAQGFRYVFLDLKTGSIDQTPEKTLQQKFLRLAEMLSKSSKVKLLLTDNYVMDEKSPVTRLPNGQQAKARPGLRGQLAYFGNLALFELQ